MGIDKNKSSNNSDGASLVSGVIWNLVALVFLGVSGIGLNIVIGRYYGPETLGTFNIAFALYIAISQFAVFGLQFAVLHAVSIADPNNSDELSQSVYSGLLLCIAISLTVTFIATSVTPALTVVFPRIAEIETAWLLAAPGLVFFSTNKYLLAVINGLQNMKAYAAFQSGRFIGLFLGLIAMILLKAPGQYLTLILVIAEILLSGALLAYILRVIPLKPLRRSYSFIRQTLQFGVKVLPGGLVAELNTRVDVLMLGAFMNDRAVGIYTVASLVYEAAMQAVVVVRNNISPQLARDLKQNDKQNILNFSRKIAFLVTSIAILGSIVTLLSFTFAARIIFQNSDFLEAAEPLKYLMVAFCCAAAPLCYSLIFSQANKPGWQSLVMLLMLLTNIGLNLIFIPMFGIVGASYAVSLSTIIGGISIVFVSRLVLGVRIFV